MSTSQTVEYNLVDQPEDEPVVLMGRPGALFGQVRFKNPGENRVVLRNLNLRGRPEKSKRQAALPALDASLATVVLRPGQGRVVPLSLSIEPYTPPGEYHFEMQVGERAQPVVLHVTEAVELEISPEQIVVENRPGARYQRKVVFANRGNVPLAIGDLGAVPLDDDLLQCRILRAAVDAVGEETHPLEEYLAEIARQARVVLDKAGTLRVNNTAGSFELAPGEVRAVELEIRVPDSLDKRGRYRAAIPLYTSDLEFVIVPAPWEAERSEGD
jgi:hypothetical protein